MFKSAPQIFLDFIGRDKTQPAIKSITQSIGRLNAGFQFGAGIAAFRAVENALSGVIEAAGGAAIEAVKVASEYEKTRNTLEVFTGSTRRAKDELAEITELARNTQGLSLPDAQKGVVRLRALGFEARTARDLVAGIALNKTLSGSDESAVNRVIQNLEQLKSGSPQVKKDIQQMVLAIPSLSKVIDESFGSLEKFQTAIKKNPDAALNKFAEAAKNTQIDNAGLSASLIGLENEFTTAQTLFAEPILNPLTESVQNLTKFIKENQQTWSDWGNYVADVIAGINAPDESLIPKPPNAPNSKYGLLGYKDEKDLMAGYNSGQIGLTRYTASLFSMAFRDADQFTRNFGEPDAVKSYLTEKQKIGQNRRMLSEGSKRLRADGTIDFSEFSGYKTAKEQATDAKAAEDDLNRAKERARQQDLASLKRNSDAETAVLKNRYAVEQALLDVSIRYTNEQEADYISRSAQIKQNYYKDERARITSYYDNLISLTEAGSDEALKAEADKQKELSNLNAQQIQDAYKSQRAILELELKTQNERRQNNIKFNQLQIGESQQSSAKQIFELQRNLDKGNIDYQDFYDRQISIANDSLKTLLELNRKNLELELQDKSLTFEEIRNLRRESALEEQRLTQENSEKIYQIQKDSIERGKDLITTFAEFRSNIISSASDIQGGFADLFFGNRSTGGQSKTAVNALRDGYLQGFNELKQEIDKYTQKAHAEDVRLGILNKNKSVISTQSGDVSAEIEKAKTDLQSLEDSLKNLSQGFETGAGSRYALDAVTGKYFDTITKKTVEQIDNGEASAALESRIAEQKTLIAKLQSNQQSFSQLITTDAQQTDNGFWSIVKQLEGDLKSLERYKALLNDAVKTFEGFKPTPEGVDELQMKFLKNRHKAEIDDLNVQIDAQRGITSDTTDSLQKQKERLKLTELEQRAEAVRIRQFAEEEEAYRKSIPGLKDYIRALSEGDAQATAFARNAARKTIYEEQSALLENNIALVERINAVGADLAARFQNAWLTAILAVKNVNIEAVESQIQSQVKLADAAVLHTEQIRAKVLQGLAQAKNINDVLAESILKAGNSLTNLLDKNLGKLGDVPILGDLLKFGNQQFTTNLTRNLLDKFFPSEFKELFDKERNPIAAPIVEQQKTTNKLLAAIAGRAGVTSAVGAAGTSSGGGSLIQKFLGLFGLGGSSGGATPPFFPSSSGYPNVSNFSGGSNVSTVPFGSSAEEIARQIRLRQAGEDYPGTGRTNGGGVGTIGTIGALASIAGGLVGGRAGSFLSNIGGGIATGAQLGSIIPGIGTVVGAVAGGAFGLIRSLFGGDPNRKKDKKENIPALQQAFTDAFQQYTQLIADVRALRAEPDGALSTGDQLRSQIASGFGIQFLSKKYKKESQNLIKAKLNQIDVRPGGLREQLERAVEMAKVAGDRANRILPEFATGGFLSNSFMSQFGDYKRDYGLLKGGIPGVDSIPVLAQEDEMFLTRRHQAEIIRGAGYDVFQHTSIPNYPKPKMMENGGFLGTQTVTTSAPTQNNFVLELHNVRPDTKVFLRSAEGRKEIKAALVDMAGFNMINRGILNTR